MKRSLILAAVSMLALSGTGGALAMDDTDALATRDNPAPAIDMPVIDKPAASMDAPDAGLSASMPGKPDPETVHDNSQAERADKPSINR